MDKKAITVGMSTLIIIIFFVISAGLLIAHFMGMGTIVQDGQEGLACHLMLGLQKASDDLKIVPTINNQCRTISKTLPQEGKTSYQVQKELANMLANTAWILHHGNINDVWDTNFFEDEKCFIMYQFSLDPQKISSDTQIEPEHYLKFLNSTQYKVIDDVPYTYSEYILSHPDAKSEVDFSIFISQPIKAKETYVIGVFAGAEDSKNTKILKHQAVGVLLGPLGSTYSTIQSVKTLFSHHEYLYVLSVMPLQDALEAQCFTR
ncbi:MAG: hypothetical protein ACLFNM_00200 [Candidatus Woesearchaeota archaeon]